MKVDTMGLLKLIFGKSKKTQVFMKEKIVKILVMGKERVGKTTLIHKLCNPEEFVENYKPTLYDVYEKTITVDEYNVKFQFMELGGSQNFPSMQDVFVRQADIYILVYAYDDKDSYKRLLELRDQLSSIKNKHTAQLPVIVANNKIDLRNKLVNGDSNRRKSIRQWCFLLHEVSAKTDFKVNAVMDSLIEESKFIGNDDDFSESKVSGRYIYKDNREKSELFHKAPSLFRHYDNSDEKMEKRLQRSTQKATSKSFKKCKFNQRSAAEVRRSNSLSALSTLRRSFRRYSQRRRAYTRVEVNHNEKPHRNISESIIDWDLSTPSAGSNLPKSNKISESQESITKYSVSSMSIKSEKSFANQKNAGVKNNSVKETPSATTKRNLFKQNKRLSTNVNDTFVEQLNNLGGRRKSLSSNALTIIDRDQGECFENSTDKDNSKKKLLRARSVSVHSSEYSKKNKPAKLEIVHPQLKGQPDGVDDSNATSTLTGRKHQRSFSAATRRLSRILPGRRLSISIDALSDSNESSDEKATKLNGIRRRSFSQNDLLHSIQVFNEKNALASGESHSKFWTGLSRKRSVKTFSKNKVSKPIFRGRTVDDADSLPSDESLSSIKRIERRRWSRKKSSCQSNQSSVSTFSTGKSSLQDQAIFLRQSSSIRRKSLSSNDLPKLDKQAVFLKFTPKDNKSKDGLNLQQEPSDFRKISAISGSSGRRRSLSSSDATILLAKNWPLVEG